MKHDVIDMRTTLDLDPDILNIARALAAREGSSMGKVISRLAREGLQSRQTKAKATRNGLPQFPVRPGAGPVTLELVNRFRDAPS